METLLKTNLLKEDPIYYKARKKAEIVNLEAYEYLTISGNCAPENKAFTDAIEAIYTIAYAIKFGAKAAGKDFVVPKMECQWWIKGGLEVQHRFTQTPRDQWHWKIAIRMPGFIDRANYENALSIAKFKKPKHQQLLDQVNFEVIDKGTCAQILHQGSYEAELPSIQQILSLMAKEGYVFRGYHTEIYLSEPTRTQEANRKTILRYQVAKAQN